MNQEIVWKEEIPLGKVFDYKAEDEEFLRNFNVPIESSSPQGTGDSTKNDAINAQNYVGMEVGLRRGQEGDLQRATLRRRVVEARTTPCWIGGGMKSNMTIGSWKCYWQICWLKVSWNNKWTSMDKNTL